MPLKNKKSRKDINQLAKSLVDLTTRDQTTNDTGIKKRSFTLTIKKGKTKK